MTTNPKASQPDTGVVERLRDMWSTDDHARGCQGREYDCSCGYDRRSEVTAQEAATLIMQQREELAVAERNRDAARGNFLTMQQAAAQLLARAEALQSQLDTVTREREEARAAVVAAQYEHGEEGLMREAAERERDAMREANAALMRERGIMIDTKHEQFERLRRRLDMYEVALSFVRRWAIEKDGNGTSAEERLSAIAHHPGIALQPEASK